MPVSRRRKPKPARRPAIRTDGPTGELDLPRTLAWMQGTENVPMDVAALLRAIVERAFKLSGDPLTAHLARLVRMGALALDVDTGRVKFDADVLAAALDRGEQLPCPHGDSPDHPDVLAPVFRCDHDPAPHPSDPALP